jgi:hypothetical protein
MSNPQARHISVKAIPAIERETPHPAIETGGFRRGFQPFSNSHFLIDSL